MGDGSEMQQMLLNLLINAEQALTGAAGKRVITIRTMTTSEERVQLQVADTGPGFRSTFRKNLRSLLHHETLKARAPALGYRSVTGSCTTTAAGSRCIPCPATAPCSPST